MLRKNFDDLQGKGDWYFIDGHAFIALMYGDDKYKNLVTLPIDNRESAWKWNGDEEKPTLEPSILVHPYPGFTDGWHGFLRNGELVDA